MINDHELNKLARELYNEVTSNDPHIHCNRFPIWEELSPDTREEYRERIRQAQKKL